MRTARTSSRAEDVAKHKDLGYKAIRVQSGMPGLKSTYGVAKAPGRYEPAERGLPHEYEWSREPYLRACAEACLRRCGKRLARNCTCCTIAIIA